MATYRRLQRDEVHVWIALPSSLASCTRSFETLLSRDEQDRACRLQSGSDAKFVIRRGLLRVILSFYLGISPGELRFDYGPQGKPAIAEPPYGSNLHFSLSCSGQVLAYAITSDHQVGLDVEEIRTLRHVEEVVMCFFSGEEQAAFRMVPAEHQLLWFLRVWTCKEAYLKATGCGLSQPLDSFSVVLSNPSDHPMLSSTVDAAVEGRSLLVFEPASGYVGAACTDSCCSRLSIVTVCAVDACKGTLLQLE